MVSAATIRQDLFDSLRTLIVANKPTYTYNSATVTYSVVPEYPQDNPTFPCVVINKGMIKVVPITMDAATHEYDVEVQLDFYAKELHGKLAIDTGQDELLATFISNIPTFIATDKLYPADDFWSDSGNSTFEDRNQVLNTSSSFVRFKF